MKDWIQIVNRLEQLLSESNGIALATVVHVDGSAYRRPGARMLVTDDGNWWGAISGGCLEGDMLKKAQMAIMTQQIKLVTYDTREDDPFQLGVGLGCQGLIDIVIDPVRSHLEAFYVAMRKAVTSYDSGVLTSEWDENDLTSFLFEYVPQSDIHSFDADKKEIIIQKTAHYKLVQGKSTLLEYIPPMPRIWIFGNQFDALALIQQINLLGWEIHWVGNVTKMNPQGKKLVNQVYDWEADLHILPEDSLVIMTHDFDRDVFLMKKLSFLQSFAYWGILGPQKRMDKLQGHLHDEGIDITSLRKQISSPIGLDVGAEGPEEIAISIIAEIIAQKNQRDAQPLKFREKPIHL
ncbi:XdhC family protein [Aquirufa aurantiipilula]|uniref:XdhC family protein n=1 Tax=Aquirufa aurantiipilula TaxID=2696561 RepID=UPI001CAA7021|nr:XdhC family protein [Aquirufa aurantiipilula]MBZ1325519.1 XdhC family protein [Aquirufa aurantiipilula]